MNLGNSSFLRQGYPFRVGSLFYLYQLSLLDEDKDSSTGNLGGQLHGPESDGFR